MAREFLDTNVLVYAFTTDARATTAEAIMARRCDISVQTLNEFANVAHRKLGMTWNEINDALDAIKAVCGRVHTLDLEIHERAVKLAERYGFSMFDALLIASALNANCSVFYSEDMHDGLVVEEQLQISNPVHA